MNNEELLRPRYKVIADYPNSIFEIGEIIEGYEKITSNSFYSDYPNIFKKLDWWENRNIEDLPEYLKDTWSEKCYYCKVDEYFYNKHKELKVKYMDRVGNYYFEFLTFFQPSTKEEYEANQHYDGNIVQIIYLR